MSENRLGDYLTPDDDQAFEADRPDIAGAMFQQETNTLKIEKLSQRVTIISVIIPCIIIAILTFIYLDITEKVGDADQTQANQMAQVSQDLETKLNALDVRIAKATHELDEKLTSLETKRQALENQTAKMSAAKVDLKTMEAALVKLDKRIKANAVQNKSTLATTERINRELLSAIDKNSSDSKAVSGKIKKEFRLFKEEFDARLLELSAYEQRMAQLGKETSLLGKKLDQFKKETAASIDKKLGLLKQDLKKQISEVKRRADAADSTAKKAAAAAAKTTPQTQSKIKPQAPSPPDIPPPTQKSRQLDLPELKTPGTGGISEQDLSQ